MSIRRYVGLCLGVVFLLAAPALAQTVSFLDANGSAVSTYLENTRVHVRVEDPAANAYPWSAETISASLSASLSGDSESLTLTETGRDTGVFEGSMDLHFDFGGPFQPGVLETTLQAGPPVVRDTLTAQYNSVSDTAGMVAGRIELLDDLGRPAAGYTQGDLVRVRLEDHLSYNDPGVKDSIVVAVNVLAVSDEESISLLETGNNTGIFAGSIPAALYETLDNDGVVGAPAGNQVHAQHSVGTLDEWLDVSAPLVGSRAEILDGSGRATELVAESSTIRLRAVNRTIGALTIPDTIQVSVSSLLGGDQETVTLTETGAQTGVFEANFPTRFNIVEPTLLGNGRLETGEDAGPPHQFDTITLVYNALAGASSDTAATYGSETRFVDEWGNDTEVYAVATTVFIRVVDHNYDQSAALDTVTALVTGFTRGDSEVVNLVETGSHTGVFEGSLPIQYGFYNVGAGDGWLEADAGETIEVRHTDALGNTASADLAVLRNVDIHFFDEQGGPTHEVLEGGYASIRLYNFPANYSPWDVDTNSVEVRSLLSGDIELVPVTETSRNSGIFEGTIRLVFSAGATNGSGTLEVFNSGTPDYTQDTVTAGYSDIQASASTVGARLWLIDSFGQDAETFAAGDLVGVRVEDHNVDNPQALQTIQVTAVTNPETGDSESVSLTETGYATGVFEGTVPSWLLWYFTANDGYLQVQAQDRLEARHAWMYSPQLARDSAVITGSSVLFVDAQGQPAGSYREATRAYVRLVYAGGNVSYGVDDVSVTLSAAVSSDSETLLLTETGGNTGVFTGSIALGNPANGPSVPNNYVLEPGRNTAPAELDTLTVTHTWYGGSASDTVAMAGSRTWFVDAAGNPVDKYARDSRAYVRVEDHVFNQPGLFDTVQVTLRSISTGDQETLILVETGRDTGVFAGSMELDSVINGTTFPYPGDGKLQSDTDEEIEAFHEEWGVVAVSSDRARITYASVAFVDESGAATVELLEGGVARLRVFDPYGGYSSTVYVSVQSLYGADYESVTLTETSYQSHVYEGTVQLRTVGLGAGLSSNGTLETASSGPPEYRAEQVTVFYSGDQIVASTVPSRAMFIDGFGRVVSSFAVGDAVGVRVEDHNVDNPSTRGTVTVAVQSLAGDVESVTLTETGYATNVFESFIQSAAGGPASGNGSLQVQAGGTIEVRHGNATTPAQTVAQAGITGSAVLFLDAAGQPAAVYFEGSRAWVRVTDAAAAGSLSVTATLRTALGTDVETVWLGETAPSSGVFTGSIALGTGPATVNNSILSTMQDAGPPHEFDTLRAEYNGVVATAATISSRTWFVDAWGTPTDKYSRESRAYVRVEDHVADRPGLYDTVTVTLRSLTTGDQETLMLQETARDGGIFAGWMDLDSVISGTTYPNPGDGKLQSDTDEEIEVERTDWAGYTSSSDRARITYASVIFVDESGAATAELLEGGVARLRVYDPYGGFGSTVNVGVQSLYGVDYENVTLTETSYQSRVYEGTLQLRTVGLGAGVSSNGTLETASSGPPEYRADRVTVYYNGDQAVASTVPSRAVFIDGFGQVVSSFAVGDAVGVRVEDHNADNPSMRGTVTVAVQSLAGDVESVTLTETGYDTNVFEGFIQSAAGGPASGNGSLQVQAGGTIEVRHSNATTPAQTTAQAAITGSSVLFVDGSGQPAGVYLEGSRAWVRVADATASGPVAATLRTALGTDVETVTLAQTAPGVFTGSIALGTGPATGNDSVLSTMQDAGPPHEFDTLRAEYNGAVATASTISSRTWFVDAWGTPTDKYSRESRAHVRVEDHVADRPGLYDTVTVTLRSLTTGDQETLMLQETARDGGIFAGWMDLDSVISGTTYPNPGDGKLQSDTDEEIEVVHTDWAGYTSSSDRAWITYASVIFVDESGAATAELLEGGVARLRVYDPYGGFGSTVNVGVQSLYGVDYESATLTETSYQSRVYEGTLQLRSVGPGAGLSSNGTLETASSGPPEYRAEQVTVYYNGDQAVASTVPSRAMFIDGFGRVVSSFAVGDAVGVRVEDHNADNPSTRGTVTVAVQSLAGDVESVTLTETGYDTNVFEGSIPSAAGGPASGNGSLQVQAGGTIEVRHGNATTPAQTVAQAGITGSSVLFVDAAGQPAGVYLEGSRAWVRVADATASGPVAATLRTALGTDVETVTLAQASPGVFTGSIALGTGPATGNDNVLSTVQAAGPPHEFDTLRAEYNGAVATASTISSRTWFVDAWGTPTDKYSRESRAYVRVEDHVADRPGLPDTVTVTLRSLTTGDQETLLLAETAEGGHFAGSMELDSVIAGTTYPNPGDGKLQSDTDEEIEVVHTDWTGYTSSSDRARITYASVIFVDEAGVATVELLEGGVARLRVFDPYGGYSSTVSAGVQSLYGVDYENVTLTETSYQSRVYEGTLQLRTVGLGAGLSSNGTLETASSGPPEYRAEQVTVYYNGDQAVASTVPSRVWFLGPEGQAVTQYALGSQVRLRVEDHNADNAGQVDSVTVNLTTPADAESLTLTETGAGTGVFEGAIASSSVGGIGVIDAAPGVTITAEHGNATTPNPTRAQAVFNDNHVPVAVDDAAQTEEAPVTIPVLANDSDPDAEALQVTAVTQGANGAAVINGDQTVTYTPNAAFLGTDVFTYIASDPRGGQAQATVTVTVLSANEAPTPAADNVTTPEDTPVTITVLANDTDPDNDPLEVIGSGFPSNGTAERQPDGTILYTPENNWSGQTSFTYMVRDPEGLTAYALVTVTVTPVNDPPVGVADSATTDEDTPVTVNVLANDSDPDGDVLDVTYTTGVTHGIAVVNADNTVTFTPQPEYSGTVLFSYAYTDGTVTGYADVTVTINAVNDAPVAVDDATEVAEDGSATVWVLTNDSDVEGDTLDVAAVTQGASGAVVLNADDTVTYTPNANFNGSDSFTYTLSDGNGGTDTATVAVNVVPANDAPTAAADTATTPEDTPVTVSVLANDSDLDGDTLTVSAVTQGTNGSVAIAGGSQVTYTPNANFHGTDSFTYTANDGNGGTDTATVSVTVNSVNDAPVANDDAATVAEDSSVSVTVLANDSDADGDTLDVTAVTQGANGAVVLNADETATYTPNANFHGSDSFTYAVADGNGGTDTATVTVTVTAANDAPVAGDDTAATPEDTPVTVSVLANDSDLDGDTLTVSAVTQGTNGTVAILGSSQVTYTPNANFHGTDSFTYTANDGNGGTDTATVTVTINPTNDAPVAGDDAASVVEDDQVAVAVLGNDSDVDGDSLTITAVTQGTNGAVAIVGSTVTYTPAPNYNGTDTFTYTISDGNGGTDTATVSMTITASNDALTAVDDAATVAEDGSVTVAVLANDTDPENDPLTVISVTQGTNGSVAIAGNQVTYTPNADFNGTDSFTYTASDGNGGTGGATVTVTVTPVNDAPVAGDDTSSVVEDGSVTISVLGDDTDVDGDTLTITAVTQGTNGTVVILGSSQVTYTPGTNFNGTDSFTYTVSDGNGGTDTANVTVTVGAANDAPVANDDSASTAEDTAVTVSVLTNDTDLDGDTLGVASVTQGTNGAVTISGTDVVYTPGADFHGSDSFTYTASDGNGGTATATVTVTVSSVNDAPVAVADSASVAEDGSIPVSVLGNDTDVDGDSLSLTAVTQGTNGSVAISGSQAVYTPNANYNGPDSFTYTISDGTGGGGGSAVGTVTVTVTGENDAPVAVDDSASVEEDGSAVVSVRSNDTDLDGDTLTITAVTQGANGSVTHNGSTVTYTPAANYNGGDAFTYTVSDGTGGGGGSATASVAVTVTPVNDAPVAVDDTATTLAEVPVVVSVRANDSDIDSPALTVTAVTQGAHGAVAINAGATVTYTPAAGWVGPDAFTYTISDGSGGTSTATVDVTVQAPPRVTGNLQVLYTFNEGSGTTVNDVSGVGTPLNLTISNASAVTWLPGALSLNTSVLVQSAGTATKVINASKSSNEVTVEAWVSPDNLTQTGPSVIASIAQNTTKRNVTLGQSTNTYNGQLRTSATSQAGTQLSTGAVASLSLTHVVYTRSSTGAVRIYVNGTQVATSTLTGNLSGWSNYSLALGGEPNGARYWLGDMHLVAIYSRALTAAEARQNWLSGAN